MQGVAIYTFVTLCGIAAWAWPISESNFTALGAIIGLGIGAVAGELRK